MNLFSLLAIAGCTLFLTFASGYLVLRALGAFSFDECVSMSGVAGCSLLAGISFASFLTRRFAPLYYVEILLVIAAFCLVIIKRRNITLVSRAAMPWLPYGLILWGILVCLQLLAPIYTGAFRYGDWWMHFDISLFFLGDRPLNIQYFDLYTIPSRTPLFNLFSGFYLAIFPNEFAVYQLSALVPGIALLAICPLLTSTNKTNTLLFLICLNPFLITNILFPWPKILAAALILAAVYCYLRYISDSSAGFNAYLLGWSVFMGLAILTHASALIYALGVYLHHLIRRHQGRFDLRRLLFPGLITLIILIPWLAWVYYTYGMASLLQASPASAQASIFSGAWWLDRAVNALGTLLPLPLILQSAAVVMESWMDSWLRFYYAVLPGTLTMTASVLLLISSVHGFKSKMSLKAQLLVLLSVTGFVGGVLLQPGRLALGLVGESMTPILLFGLLAAAHIIQAMKPHMQRLLLLLVGLEFFSSRGLDIFRTAAAQISRNDPNLILKQEHHLVFAWDIAGHNGWYFLGGAAIFGYIALYWITLQAISAHQRSAPDK